MWTSMRGNSSILKAFLGGRGERGGKRREMAMAGVRAARLAGLTMTSSFALPSPSLSSTVRSSPCPFSASACFLLRDSRSRSSPTPAQCLSVSVSVSFCTQSPFFLLGSSFLSSSGSLSSLGSPAPAPLFCSTVAAAESSVSVDSSSPAEVADSAIELDLLDIRIGRILKAWKHPEADSLYVEEVDMGEAAGPRTICSGLVKYVSEEELQGRAVVVLANLKPRNMRGVKSNGMLLAASDAMHEHVELLTPPEGAVPGERIWFGSEADQANQAAAGTPNQVQKKKVWESIQPLLKTTEEGVAVFQDRAMRASTGIVTSTSLKGANIS